MEIYEAAEAFVSWLERNVVVEARGDQAKELKFDPKGRFWLGRLAPEHSVISLGQGDRGERLDPCAIGLRTRPVGAGPWAFTARVRACSWRPSSSQTWHKTAHIDELTEITVQASDQVASFGQEQLARAFAGVTGNDFLSAEVRVEIEQNPQGQPDLTVTLVNVSPDEDSILYECSLEIIGLETEPYTLEALPDSFRYDRRVEGYGINCDIAISETGTIHTIDAASVDRGRPSYWNVEAEPPDLSFKNLATDPRPTLEQLLVQLKHWGDMYWSEGHLRSRALKETWSPEMLQEAFSAATDFAEEVQRIETGIKLLQDGDLLKTFKLMNRAMIYSSRGKYDSWRPFQVGFLLANLRSIVDPSSESDYADVVWFATGGGKTETYLGLLVIAAFHDRLRGKRSGVTAWSRFPLRMLSLQQTQRFADAIAGAERVRREESIPGDSFGIGFLVGEGATPNRISIDSKEDEPNPDDETMPGRYKVLSACPFCHSSSIMMTFNRADWRLEHRCTSSDCPWQDGALPFYVVDEEIYRFLPTILVGTLDKAASIGLQAAMRGLIGPPIGRCSMPGHGYTYAPRSKRPNGCLSPGCNSPIQDLEMPHQAYGPSFRLQDELHLLRDSLGAVNSHYETLFDHLENVLCGHRPKILASSATLTGYEHQVEVLYARKARVFPVPGPSMTDSFWTSESTRLARRFVALAPRGVTLEFAVDRTLTTLQKTVRRLINEPEEVCKEVGVPSEFAPTLLSLYGVDLVYGNTLRDLDATARSMETQIEVDGPLNSDSLTGKTEFENVREILHRLDHPEENFDERLHLIAASSMMSHGVDIDRLNVMLVLGLPLTTAEFIQATARVGRKWPGLVFVMHKIARERDASVYRSFNKFIKQGDRFVEAIPITRRSRRVLEKTIAGLVFARILAVHEPSSKDPLTTISRLRQFFERRGISEATEIESILDALSLDRKMDELMVRDIEAWMSRFFRKLRNPSGSAKFPHEVSPTGNPMRSLRDVEDQVPIWGRSDR